MQGRIHREDQPGPCECQPPFLKPWVYLLRPGLTVAQAAPELAT